MDRKFSGVAPDEDCKTVGILLALAPPQMIDVCCLFQMKDITREPAFLGKVEKGETFTIQKDGVTV